MKFKAKLRKIGNSMGIIIPKEVITFIEDTWSVNVITVGDHIYLDVITDDSKYVDLEEGVITEANPNQGQIIEHIVKHGFSTEYCTKHKGSYKGTCGCK